MTLTRLCELFKLRATIDSQRMINCSVVRRDYAFVPVTCNTSSVFYLPDNMHNALKINQTGERNGEDGDLVVVIA